MFLLAGESTEYWAIFQQILSPMHLRPILFALAGFALFAIPSYAEGLFKPFADPARCIRLPLKYGLKTSTGVPPSWQDKGLGWYSQTEITTHKGRLTRVGDVDNNITCRFQSDNASAIKYVVVKANCFNAEGEGATLAKYNQFVTDLLKDLGIQNIDPILKGADAKKGKEISTDTYSITIKREEFKFGYGWVFQLDSK